MAMARLAVSLPCNAAGDGQAIFWLGVIAFGKQADALTKHRKGISPSRVTGVVCPTRQTVLPDH